MRAVIIGCGYVGSAVAKQWRSQGVEVAVTTRNPAKSDTLKEVADEVIVGMDWDKIVTDRDVIVLCVAPDRGGDYADTYLKTAKELIKHAADCHIIYTSSTSVYGDAGGEEVTETSPLFPMNESTQILVDTEAALLASPNSCILRLGEIIGPGRSPINRLKRMQGQTLAGTGENPVNLSPLDVIVAAIDFAATNKLVGIFNVCTPFHPKRKEWYKELCEEAGIPEPKWNPSHTPTHGGNRIVVSKKLEDLGLDLHTHSKIIS